MKYSLLLVALLPEYQISASRRFVVNVKPCEAELISVNAQLSLEDIWREWSSDAFYYKIEGAIKAYSQVPACGYALDYTIQYEDKYNNPGVRTTDAPVEALYSPSTYTFKIEKCSDAQKPFDLSRDPECANVPFEKLYNVWIHAWLVGEPRKFISESVGFDVMIGNVCQTDVLSLTDLFGDLTYTLRSPGQPLTERFTVLQDHTECPRQCLLSMPDGSEIPGRYGIPMQTKSLIEINSEDKGLNGESIDLTFRCKSTLSQLGPDSTAPVIVHNFKVNYVDECELSEIYPALTQDANVYAFSETEITYTPPYSQYACNAFTNKIVFPPDHPENGPIFRLNQQQPGIIEVISGYSRNKGNYSLKIESCITIFSTGEKRCVLSQPFAVNVVDPCPITEIFSAGFSKVMTAP